MPVIVGVFCAPPFLAGSIVEHSVYRLTRRRWWKLLPPTTVVALTVAVAVRRAGVWGSGQSPLTQLLSVPGLPALFVLLGLPANWRLWERLWGPQVVKDRGARWIYLHLDQDVVVSYWNMLTLFGLDNTNASHLTRRFLERAERAEQAVNVVESLPESFVFCRPASGEITVYLFQLSTATLFRRAKNSSSE